MEDNFKMPKIYKVSKEKKPREGSLVLEWPFLQSNKTLKMSEDSKNSSPFSALEFAKKMLELSKEEE